MNKNDSQQHMIAGGSFDSPYRDRRTALFFLALLEPFYENRNEMCLYMWLVVNKRIGSVSRSQLIRTPWSDVPFYYVFSSLLVYEFFSFSSLIDSFLSVDGMWWDVMLCDVMRCVHRQEQQSRGRVRKNRRSVRAHAEANGCRKHEETLYEYVLYVYIIPLIRNARLTDWLNRSASILKEEKKRSVFEGRNERINQSLEISRFLLSHFSRGHYLQRKGLLAITIETQNYSYWIQFHQL